MFFLQGVGLFWERGSHVSIITQLWSCDVATKEARFQTPIIGFVSLFQNCPPTTTIYQSFRDVKLVTGVQPQ